jgi:hypothetical protein
VYLLLLQSHRETDRFFTVSGVQLPEHDRGQFHYHRTTFCGFVHSRDHPVILQTVKSSGPVVSPKDPIKIFSLSLSTESRYLLVPMP